jgi:hypothetical protein
MATRRNPVATAAARTRLKRGSAGVARVLVRVVAYSLVAILVLFAVGGAVGRIRLAPAPDRVAGTAYESTDLVVVVPVPVQKLRVGDTIIVRNSKEKALLHIDNVVDSAGPQVHVAGDPPERVRKLSGQAWRVRTAVPYAGFGMGLLAGPIQGALFAAIGFILVVRAEVRRSRDSEPRSGEGGAVADPLGA